MEMEPILGQEQLQPVAVLALVPTYISIYTPWPPPGRGPNLPKGNFTKQKHEFESTPSQIAILISLTYVLKKNF